MKLINNKTYISTSNLSYKIESFIHLFYLNKSCTTLRRPPPWSALIICSHPSIVRVNLIGTSKKTYFALKCLELFVMYCFVLYAIIKISNYILKLPISVLSQCNSAILETVDNYALLNLDIVWCYLCLKSISQVPEAEERLRKCEQSFHKSYGPNMERLMSLKGTTGKHIFYIIIFTLHFNYLNNSSAMVLI